MMDGKGGGSGGPPGAERRQHTRYEILAQTVIGRPDEVLIFQITNLSRGGAFIRIPDLPSYPFLELGVLVEIDIIDPADLENIHLEAEVVRTVTQEQAIRTGQEPGIGVAIVNVDKPQRLRLESLLERLAQGWVPPPLPPADP